jgi:hypothetical protein
MRSVFKTIIAASALAATTVAVVQPAQARDRTGVAVAAGIIGLGVGAAIASDHRGYDRGGYYYNEYPTGYYAPSYNYSYGYAQPYGYSYGYDYGRGYGYDHGRDWGRDHWRDDRGHHDHGDRHDRHDDGGWRR